MKESLLYSLYKEASDPEYESLYRDLRIDRFAVSRICNDKVEDKYLYHAIQTLYEMTPEQVVTLFNPQMAYGSVAKKMYKRESYNAVWLAYFPMWFALEGFDLRDFSNHAYWVLSPGEVDGKHPEVRIIYDTAENVKVVRDLLIGYRGNLPNPICKQLPTRNQAVFERMRLTS